MNKITKHFKDSKNNIFGISIHGENVETWESEVGSDWTEITLEEAHSIANPAPTQAELDAQQEAENIAFLSSENQRVNIAIAPLDDAIEFEIATEDEIHKHTELRKYRLLLSRVPNQDTWPLDPTWPTCPEFFKPKE